MEVSLAEVAEFGVEVKSASLLVPKELILERKTDVASCGIPRHDSFR
jgi:hypothetical protein